ncbi:hypothetical protein WMY93_012205 [Mugilogobius chulae]|uniref:TEA domain-containing protein n=1 Tax=Mugilogobius chulae TaxID=88201 RepID=A0AAW0P8G0_9GOBI
MLTGGAATIASNEWSANGSPEDGLDGDNDDKTMDGDAEGVWSPDIEQSFQEALAIYPPCGRRKIILSDEGKMYGRNELIARYIKLRTGKTRTRKQVSSHIQVLARKKVREYQAGIKAMNLDQASKDKALQNMAALSSAQIVSPSIVKNLPPLPPAPYQPFWRAPIPGQPGPSQELVLDLPGRTPGFGRTSHAIKPFVQPPYPTLQGPVQSIQTGYEPLAPPPAPTATAVPVWQDRTIASSKLRMLEYSAFMEVQRDPDTYSKHLFVHIGQTNPSYSDPLLEAVDIRQIYDKFPEKKGGLKELYEKGPQNAFFLVKFWANLNSSSMQDGPGSFYGVSSQYSSNENMTITVSTKVCSFGKQVVEKVETEYARVEGGKCVYRIHRSPMCEYMINFIHKLKHLPEKYMMNSVLENFTILQVVTNRDTQETLLCIAFVFEVSTSEHGAQDLNLCSMASSAVTVRVFSLNCWGIRYLSKQCAERYAMIGDFLSSGEHDIVLLQEVWSEKDFLGLKKKLAFSHPHSHYFKSHTSAGADAVIVGGDLNMHPQDLGTRLLMSYTGLKDAYLETSQFDDQASKDKALQNMAALSSAQIVSPSIVKNLPPLPPAPYQPFWRAPIPGQPGPSQELVLDLPGRTPGFGRTSHAIKPFVQPPYPTLQGPVQSIQSYEPLAPPPAPTATAVPVWQDRTIASSKLRMLEYSAFMEVQRDPDTYSKHLFVHIGQTNPSYSDPLLEAVDIRQIYDKFPEKKANLNSSSMQDGPGSFYGVSSQYSSNENMTITVSTKTEYARVEGGKCVYRIHRSPMCEYMINFIHKLKHLPEKYMMNSVLENFTILQVVTNRDTQETLLCIAFVFEVSTSEHGAQYHVYRLVKD